MKSSIICLLLANTAAIKLQSVDDDALNNVEIDDGGLEASISDLAK